ncbi:hypothetical protein H0H81_002522 [Sphagnurus paluster]|uniref:Uncharacterized protein n=1 Tax=Sphagnurus paluster TaxID=117069 RepID=A0A9P7KJI5_9AGAR|nr:hypothetical protein H0H81_002522 [Sphagnurus paluster]
MKYTNPLTKALKWQKAWFFLDDDVQHVMVSGISSTTSAPVYSVLDQRRQVGSVFTDTATVGKTKMQTVWHGDVGYLVLASAKLTTEAASKTDRAFQTTFKSKIQKLRLNNVRNDEDVSAVFDGAHNTAMVVFWDASGGSVTFTEAGLPPFTLSANSNAAVIYKVDSGEITVTDPSQSLSSAKITVALGHGVPSSLPFLNKLPSKTLTFTLPQGGVAGQSATQKLR